MNLKLFMSKTMFWCRQHSPELLTASSIVGTSFAVGYSVYATTKLPQTLEPHKANLKRIRDDLHDDNKIQNEIVSVKDLKKDMAKEYVKLTGRLIKLYAPALLGYALSVSCSIGSNHILRNRNLALAAAYTTLEKGYEAYRGRVKEKLGEEAEEKLFRNVKKEVVEMVDPKTGKVTKKTIEKAHDNKDENFTVMFDAGNPSWDRDAHVNYDFLMSTQAHMNMKLQKYGYLFLSDVYEALGFDVSQLGPMKARASHYIGWIYDPKDNTRDNYVSFGLTNKGTNVALPNVSKQIEMNEPSFWLSFNVDGDILSGSGKIFANYAKI